MTLAPSRRDVDRSLVLVDDTLDQNVRWRSGERLHDVLEQHVDALVARGEGDRLAIDLPDDRVTHAELDRRANRLAHRLIELGVGPGDRVGLLFDRTAHPCAAMLAVSKVHAAFVPLDASFPADRLRYLCSDAEVRLVLTRPALAHHLAELPVEVEAVDGDLSSLPDTRPTVAETGSPVDDLAYVIYTSGTTGRPKGVAIEHSSICNFVRVAAEHYGFRSDDRVYQGMTIAFDFSVEETWVPLLSGATLVPAPGHGALLGEDLSDFLVDRRITALVCVPTLLATLERDLPDLRLLMVSGESCPQELVTRWSRPGRRFLNVYGPTETTVTATWTTLEPGRPVTIGRPLPTYSVVTLDPDQREVPVPVPHGRTGEIAIAGIGLSPGYVGRPDLTERAFVPDPLGLPDNPSGRLYRTGDLGRVTADGQIEYLGRIDTQVKIRGYRIEVAEVESLLMGHTQVAQAAVTTHEPEPGVLELAAFVTGDADLDPAALLASLRERVPPYMLPAYVERLDRLPMLPSDKVDRAALPAPSSARVVAHAGPHVEPRTDRERQLADAVAQVLHLDRVSVTADLFADLGADSLRVARLCALVRADGTDLTTRDVYRHRTVQAIAAAEPERTDPVPTRERRAPHVASRAAYLGCGIVQVTFYLLYLGLAGLVGSAAYRQLDGAGWRSGYLTSLGWVALALLVLTLVPVVVKWTVVGRFDERPIAVWSVGYLRFWLVRTAMTLSPVRAFVGSPLYSLYLRSLGVRVGRDALVLTRFPPVFTDLVSIGARTVVREDATLPGYRVEAGWIVPGRVDLGDDVVIGEGTHLDIDTIVEDGAHVAHASGVAAGTRVPAGRAAHGSPAVDAGHPARSPLSEPPLAQHRVGRVRRSLFAAGQLAVSVLVTYQLLVLGVVLAVWVDVSHPLRAAGLAAAFLLLAVVVRVVVPRVAARFVPPDRALPLYGVRWSAFQLARRSANSPFLHTLFGDSALITGYLRAIGFRFTDPVQTGSNFGTAQRHDVSTLSVVGGGSIVSDGLALVHADYGSQSFRVRPVHLGRRVFTGNRVFYPADAALGDDVLLATKVMVPTDGNVRSGVGLLGSPAFEIPRTVHRDAHVELTPEELRPRLAAKLRHNLTTMGWHLTQTWLLLFVSVSAVAWIGDRGWLGLAGAIGLGLVGMLAAIVVVDHLSRGLRRLRPQQLSLYDRSFWRHERYWKVNAPVTLIGLLNGTPLKGTMWRLLGVRVGRQLFDDGATMPERSMVTLGDHVSLGALAVLHGHSLEDGAFTSDRIAVGDRTTVGAGAWVHYDVALAADALVEPDAFVMKGERAAAGSRWLGNPAEPTP